MTIDQKDIIETIDRLHAEATKASDLLRMAGVNPPSDIFALIRTVSTFNSEIHVNWPAIRDRLREAERKASDVNDELKSVLADWNEVRSASGSKTNGGLVGHITELRRKAKAFDLIASNAVGIGRNGANYKQWCVWRQSRETADGPTAVDTDLLTAIERATREAQP